jgi:hypothetical protein
MPVNANWAIVTTLGGTTLDAAAIHGCELRCAVWQGQGRSRRREWNVNKRRRS